jgi:hypothetical protein
MMMEQNLGAVAPPSLSAVRSPCQITVCSTFRISYQCAAGITLLVLNKLIDSLSQLRLVPAPFQPQLFFCRRSSLIRVLRRCLTAQSSTPMWLPHFDRLKISCECDPEHATEYNKWGKFLLLMMRAVQFFTKCMCIIINHRWREPGQVRLNCCSGHAQKILKSLLARARACGSASRPYSSSGRGWGCDVFDVIVQGTGVLMDKKRMTTKIVYRSNQRER